MRAQDMTRRCSEARFQERAHGFDRTLHTCRRAIAAALRPARMRTLLPPEISGGRSVKDPQRVLPCTSSGWLLGFAVETGWRSWGELRGGTSDATRINPSKAQMPTGGHSKPPQEWQLAGDCAGTCEPASRQENLSRALLQQVVRQSPLCREHAEPGKLSQACESRSNSW